MKKNKPIMEKKKANNMYHIMTFEAVMAVVANPNYFSEYQRKCAIYNLNKHIEYTKIKIKQYKEYIDLIRKGVNKNVSK